MTIKIIIIIIIINTLYLQQLTICSQLCCDKKSVFEEWKLGLAMIFLKI